MTGKIFSRNCYVGCRFFQKIFHNDFSLPFGVKSKILFREPVGGAFRFLSDHPKFLEFTDLRELVALVKEGFTYFDVGANAGHYVLALHDRCNGNLSVHAFEPESKAFSRLIENRRLNNAQWICEKGALGSEKGILKISTGEGGFNHILSQDEVSTQESESCPVHRLDDYCESAQVEKIDLMKIDVEGFECEVLKGAESMLSGKKIGAIVLENEGHQTRYGFPQDITTQIMRGHGYSRKDSGEGNFEIWVAP